MPTIPELRVKIRSLAQEATIIRAEEKRHTGQRRNDIHRHRVIDVRREQRATLLAYGYLRGRAYRQIEPKSRCDRAPFDRPTPNWDRIAAMVIKYGGKSYPNKIAAIKELHAWRDQPLAHKAA